VENPNNILYVIERAGDRWVFVPSRLLAGLTVSLFGAGSAFLVYLSTIFFRQTGTAPADLWIGVIFLIVAGSIASLGIRAWRTRRTPLTIEHGGRVGYGERELCAPGSVRAVRIADSRDGELGDCDVVLEQDGGKIVSIPSQYFGSFKSREDARPFAAKLAQALGVQVLESQ
jgi:hypothetical protein